MHQYLFYIGDFPVRAYGLLLSLGIISAAIVAYYFFKRDGRGWHLHVVDFAILVGIAGIIGARLWDVFFFDWDYYHNHILEIPFVWQGGMAIQGGVVLGTLAGIWYTKKHNIDTWAFGDIFAPALILGQSVGRMANLMNGDAFGHPTGGNFGILYPETTLAYKTYGAQPLWPAEIWEGQIDILIFVVLLLFSSYRHKKGQVFVLYAILYSAARFGLEFLRGDYVNLTLGLKSAQMTSLTVMVIGILIFIYLQVKGSYDEHLFPAEETGTSTGSGRSSKGKGNVKQSGTKPSTKQGSKQNETASSNSAATAPSNKAEANGESAIHSTAETGSSSAAETASSSTSISAMEAQPSKTPASVNNNRIMINLTDTKATITSVTTKPASTASKSPATAQQNKQTVNKDTAKPTTKKSRRRRK